jgi:hypothetical protein
MRFQARRFYRQSHNAYVDGAVFQLLHDLVAEIAIDADLHPGIEARILGEDIGQDIETGSLVGADHDGAPRAASLVGNREQRLVFHLQQTLGIGKQDPSRRGQGHILAGAVEQAISIFLLELPDLRADCGLRTKDLLAGARETAKLGDFEESDELVKVHVRGKERPRQAPLRRNRETNCSGDYSGDARRPRDFLGFSERNAGRTGNASVSCPPCRAKPTGAMKATLRRFFEPFVPGRLNSRRGRSGCSTCVPETPRRKSRSQLDGPSSWLIRGAANLELRAGT